MTKETTFNEINQNWENKVTKADDLLGAVGRSQDSGKLDIIAKDISSKLELGNKDILLEVGSGTGVLLSKLSEKSNSAYGVDYSSEAIKRAKKAFPKIQMNTTDAANLPFKDGKFDKLLCYSVFHYFGDMEYAFSAINEFLRVCRKGGIILIGDLPSEKHYHLSPYYNKLSISLLLKKILEPIIRLIKRRPKVKKAPIINPQKWLWFNLDKICDKLRSEGHEVDILEQPSIIQWSEVTYNHRFDLRIRK